MFTSTKTYCHNIGLSCCFRQWRAKSHCRHLHGYALEIRIEFASDQLDTNNWVVDFGALKPLKERLENWFDHALVVAADDPALPLFQDLAKLDIARVVVLEQVSCEMFARHVFLLAEHWLETYQTERELPHFVDVTKVEVKEHGGNSAIYQPVAGFTIL